MKIINITLLITAFSMIFLSCKKDEEEVEEPGALAGYVKDAETNEPIEGALLFLNTNEHSTSTNAEGYYEFTGLTSFAYAIDIEAPNYETPYLLNVSITAGETTHKDYFLDMLEPLLALNTGSLLFGTADNKSFNVYNNGPGEYLNYNIVPADLYLTATPDSGMVTNGNFEQVVITLDRTGMSPGSYNSQVHVNSNGGTVSVDVSFTVE